MDEFTDALLEDLYYVQEKLSQMEHVIANYMAEKKKIRNLQNKIEYHEDPESNISKGSLNKVKMTLLTIVWTVLIANGLLIILFDSDNTEGLAIYILMGVIFYKCLYGKKRQHIILRTLSVSAILLFVIVTIPMLIFHPIYIILGVIAALVTTLAIRQINMSKNKKEKQREEQIQAQNHQITVQNQNTAKNNMIAQNNMLALKEEYYQLQSELEYYAGSWFPPDYYNLEAVDFFINAVRNYRAKNVQEMVNLFEKTKEYQQMLQLQQQLAIGQVMIQGQLRFMNMMQIANNFWYY